MWDFLFITEIVIFSLIHPSCYSPSNIPWVILSLSNSQKMQYWFFPPLHCFNPQKPFKYQCVAPSTISFLARCYHIHSLSPTAHSSSCLKSTCSIFCSFAHASFFFSYINLLKFYLPFTAWIKHHFLNEISHDLLFFVSIFKLLFFCHCRNSLASPSALWTF